MDAPEMSWWLPAVLLLMAALWAALVLGYLALAGVLPLRRRTAERLGPGDVARRRYALGELSRQEMEDVIGAEVSQLTGRR